MAALMRNPIGMVHTFNIIYITLTRFIFGQMWFEGYLNSAFDPIQCNAQWDAICKIIQFWIP